MEFNIRYTDKEITPWGGMVFLRQMLAKIGVTLILWHSRLEEVLYMAGNMNIEILILGHFSSRYHPAEIDENIKRLCQELKIKIPVYRVLPGQVHRDILSENPIN